MTSMPPSDLSRRLRDDLDAAAGRISLTRVRLNSQGYDSAGSYWGIDAPLFCVMDRNGSSHHLRAQDRKAAKSIVRQILPDAQFYR